jgi:Xaa-Pro aminopeptidase
VFKAEVYKSRRAKLSGSMKSGIALFPGNNDVARNYSANPYHFRQDSVFLYFFGISARGLTGVIDFDSGKDYIFGDDIEIDDIIWMGTQPVIKELALKAGVINTAPLSKLEEFIKDAVAKERKIHFLPPYQGEIKMMLGSLLKENPCRMKTLASTDLIKSVVALRSIKDGCEVIEIEKAVDVAYDMHVAAMKMCKQGISEHNIFGVVEGIAWSKGNGPSFPVILSINGQTLHNHAHDNLLKEGRIMVVDCGAESAMNYASDITRSTPVGGRFNSRQKEIYEVVLKANTEAILAARPGMSNRDIHLMVCRIIAAGMKELGLMLGDIDEAVNAGAHALFMPHGLGHMLGLDVHDMEGLGEDFVGYNEEIKRSNQFGLAFLRFALRYRAGHVFTIEPGCYFIPELIDLWRSEKKFTQFIDYNKVETYKDFGGIRIEDNLLITETGHKILGKPIPKTINEVEATCI